MKIIAYDLNSEMDVELVQADFGKQLFTYVPVGVNPDIANILTPVPPNNLVDIRVFIPGQQCLVCGEKAQVTINDEEMYEVAMVLNDKHTLFLHQKCFYEMMGHGNEMIKQWKDVDDKSSK